MNRTEELIMKWGKEPLDSTEAAELRDLLVSERDRVDALKRPIEALKLRRDELNRELMSLHLQITSAEQEASPEHRCRVNGKEIISRGPVSGSMVRAKLPTEQASDGLFFENTGNAPDIQVSDGDPIPNGANLYTIPPCFGA